jgi:hypothetical protein
MAITVSGLYGATFIDALDTTQLALDLDLDTHKLALFNNTLTAPNYDTDTAYGVAPYNANEVSGTGWASGGVALTGTTLTSITGGMKFDATDVSVSATTLVAARGCLIYADVLVGNNAIVFVNFGADYSTNNGVFAIVWDALGIFTVDLTP